MGVPDESPSVYRRTFLSGLAAAAATAGAGPAAARSAPTASTARSPAAQTDSSSSEQSSPVRGESDADVSVRTEEDGEHVEYLSESDEVRYVMAWRSDRPEDGGPPEREPVYTTTGWADWAEIQTTDAAASAAADHVADEIDADGVGVGSGLSSRVPGQDLGAVVRVTDHEAESEPRIDLSTAAAATPATVDATYALDGREYEAEVPVFVEVASAPEYSIGGANATERGDAPAVSLDGNGSQNGSNGGASVASGEGGGNTSEDDANESTSNDDDLDALPGFGVGGALGAVAAAVAGSRLRDRSD